MADVIADIYRTGISREFILDETGMTVEEFEKFIDQYHAVKKCMRKFRKTKHVQLERVLNVLD